jgi:hypothetical protein
MGFGVVIILEELPLTELGEDERLAPLPEGEAVVLATLDIVTELEELVEEGKAVVPLPSGTVGVSVMLVVGVEAVEAVGDVVPKALIVGIVGEDMPVSVRVLVELPEYVGDGVSVPLIVGIEPPESVGEVDVPISVGVVTELEALVVEDEVGVMLVVLPYGGVTELMEVAEEVELNVSEEPWAQAVKRAKRRKMARHCSPSKLRINMTGFTTDRYCKRQDW